MKLCLNLKLPSWLIDVAHVHLFGFQSFPGEKKSPDTFGPVKAGGSAGGSAAKQEEEDDFDLFGSDEEADEEAEKVKAERLAMYQEKKAKS